MGRVLGSLFYFSLFPRLCVCFSERARPKPERGMSGGREELHANVACSDENMCSDAVPGVTYSCSAVARSSRKKPGWKRCRRS